MVKTNTNAIVDEKQLIKKINDAIQNGDINSIPDVTEMTFGEYKSKYNEKLSVCYIYDNENSIKYLCVVEIEDDNFTVLAIEEDGGYALVQLNGAPSLTEKMKLFTNELTVNFRNTLTPFRKHTITISGTTTGNASMPLTMRLITKTDAQIKTLSTLYQYVKNGYSFYIEDDDSVTCRLAEIKSNIFKIIFASDYQPETITITSMTDSIGNL